MSLRAHDTPSWLPPISPVCEAVSVLFHPWVEVVVHDIAADRIVALWGDRTGRRVGDPSLLAELPVDSTGAWATAPYGKVTPEGERVTAVSTVVAAGAGLLCINLHRGALDDAAKGIRDFARAATEAPPELVANDWRERIGLEIDQWITKRRLDRTQLSVVQRRELVAHLDELQLFATRKAPLHAAAALDVARSTIYSDLKEVRR